MASESAVFTVGQKVYCEYKLIYYDAKIKEQKPNNIFLVHYIGFKNADADEEVESKRLLEYTPENIAYCKEVRRRAIAGEPRLKTGPLAVLMGIPQKTIPQKAKKLVSNAEDSKEEIKPKNKPKSSNSSRSKKIAEVENYDCSNVVAIEESVPKGKDILIPPSIQKYMLFNHEAICICSEFVSLPKPKNQTVRAILSKYGNNEVQDPQSGLIEAFADSFDHFLPLRLLFSSELEQWKALTEKYPKKKASDIFGMEHFSRFLVKFPDFMKDSKTPDHIQRSLRNRINNLLEYLDEHSSALMAHVDTVSKDNFCI